MKIFLSLSKLAFICSLLSLLVACTTELKRELSQNQADEVIVVLKSEGISASKKSVIKNRDTTYLVTVSRSSYEEALRILVKHNLPTETVRGMQEICGGEESLIPSPEIDRCKFLVAKQNDIASDFRVIPGIIDARIKLNIPRENPLSDKQPRPTASVIIKYIPGDNGEKPFDEKLLREFVANAVEDLDYNDVSILATATQYQHMAKINSKQSPTKAQEPEKLEGKPESQTPSVPVETASFGGKSKQFKIFVLLGAVVTIVLAGGAITSIVYSKNLQAENDLLKKRQKQMRLQGTRALKAAPQSLAKASRENSAVSQTQEVSTPGLNYEEEDYLQQTGVH